MNLRAYYPLLGSQIYNDIGSLDIMNERKRK